MDEGELIPKGVASQNSEKSDSLEGRLDSYIEKAHKDVQGVVDSAIKNGIPPSEFDHLGEVYNPVFYNIVPPELLMLQLGVTDPLGIVSIREDNPHPKHTVTHESLHRATKLRQKTHPSDNPKQFVGKLFQVPDVYPPDFPPEKARESSELLKIVEDILVEGITEYVTLLALGVDVSDDNTILGQNEFGYPYHTAIIKGMRTKVTREPLSIERFNAIMIQIALTGNYNRILEITPHEKPLTYYLQKSAGILREALRNTSYNEAMKGVPLSGD